jgi:tyrosinase
MFDGSAYSMGGNGEYIPHAGLVLPPPVAGVNPTIYLDPGFGSGCVQTGPFHNMSVNLGPIGLPNSTVGPDGGMGYNPRCLKRDVGPFCLQKYCNYTRIFGNVLISHTLDPQLTVADLMTKRFTIKEFQDDLEGPVGTGDLGPHGGGHFAIGGDPGGDLFTSPGDPAFYLHHGQVDRLWTLWYDFMVEMKIKSLTSLGKQWIPRHVSTHLMVPTLCSTILHLPTQPWMIL